MADEFTEDFIANVNMLSPDERQIVCLEITHPSITQTVRVVQDNEDFVSGDKRFVAFNFEINFPDDVEGELAKATLEFDNVGRELVRWIEESYGAKDAKVDILIYRRSNPDAPEIPAIPAFVQRTFVETTKIRLELVVLYNYLNQRAVKSAFTTYKTPGIF